MTGAGYTRERLAEAATRCTSMDEAIDFLGTKRYPRLDSYLRERFRKFGIDISHFGRRKHQRHTRPDSTTLRDAVAASHSLAEALRRLGIAVSGSQRASLKRWIREDGLSTEHFLGQGHQRGKPGPTPLKPAANILVKHDGTRRTQTGLLRRALGEVGMPERCDRCGVTPSWRGRPMTLEIDHINGDWSDDRRENLRLLCPNCHAITSTWCRGGRRRPVAHRNVRAVD
ncbi:HNH endonuclease [Streptomyces sp. NPDC059851]|uniref:HNH endonuclease signature motif containing protein n=1 Tax=Streptomyces sp. NPDC059851 TaxID=3346971 RepID=UPI003646167E